MAVSAVGSAQTDPVCGLPGMSSFPLAAAPAPAVAAPPLVQGTAEQLDPLLREGQTKVEQEADRLRRKGR